MAQKAVYIVRGLDDLSYDPCNPYKGVKLVLARNLDKSKIGFKFKKYRFNSGYAGGHKVLMRDEMLRQKSVVLFKRMCYGQMPKNDSSRKLLSFIRVV